MSNTYGYLVSWQWLVVVVWSLWFWLQDPNSLAGLFGSFVAAYLIVAVAAYLNRNRERPTEATEAQGQ